MFLGYDIYRLAIAVTAVTLLLSPAWMSLIHRIEDMAVEGYSSYREALSEAYSSELGNVGEGLWWVRARYRAWRLALYRRRVRKAEARSTAKAREEAEKVLALAAEEEAKAEASDSGQTGATPKKRRKRKQTVSE